MEHSKSINLCEAATQQSCTRLRSWGTSASNVFHLEACSTCRSTFLLLCSLANQHGLEQGSLLVTRLVAHVP